jgi:hypothetical protein
MTLRQVNLSLWRPAAQEIIINIMTIISMISKVIVMIIIVIIITMMMMIIRITISLRKTQYTEKGGVK